MPAFYKPSLVFRDDCHENFFDSGGYYFGEDFVTCVTKGDWLESTKIDCSFLFWDKSKER